MAKCMTCDGCGKVADDGDQSPWSMWKELPPQSRTAVNLGLVHPMSCPDCGGSGIEKDGDK
jgi:hypothetical protein